MRGRARLVVASLALVNATPAIAAYDLWKDGRADLEPAGITKEMSEALSVWLEGQYFLGFCDRYLAAHEVAFWRTWWENTIVPESEIGRRLLREGTGLYDEGLEAAIRETPSVGQCQRISKHWRAKMEALVERTSTQRKR